MNQPIRLGRHAALALALLVPSAVLGAQAGPAWTRGGVCYEVFVRSFFDSDGDGIGDLKGLIAKLDYINDGNPASRSDLGANCIWLMPVAASPSYHGYDVSDYYRVEPAYGTNADFKQFIAAAHRRGIKVLVDMVVNHSSSEHPNFLAALRDTTSPFRSWYRFAPVVQGKGPWGDVAWHPSPVRNEFYYGVFSRNMPDLNYDAPAVREEGKRIATFWLREMGVDGFRLDAVPYLVEAGSCQMGCAGTHAVLRDYARHVDSIRPGVYTIGEAWGNIDAVLPYYPDQLTAYFAWEVQDSILFAVRHGVAAGLLGGALRLQDTLPAYRWSPLLGNHDQTRPLTVLDGDIARAKLAATLLLTLPGLPFVYYGEEIGMIGDKPDPRLRTPMQWNAGPQAGFTTGTPWESLQPNAATSNVAAERADSGSLLNLYRRLIHLRRSNVALATGTLAPLATGDAAVAAYVRRTAIRTVLVVANLGGGTITHLDVSSAPGLLRPGKYTVRDLLGGRRRATLVVKRDGSIDAFATTSAIGPKSAVLLELIRR